MTGYTGTFEVVIDAPVHTVFEYCRDPRRIYAGDPSHTVPDATLVPEGVGTRALVVARVAVFTEEIALEYVELVPDQRIVFEAFPRMTIARLGHRVISAGPLHTWTWAFAPEGAGTRLTLVVVGQDASRWERALDLVTGRMLSGMFSREIRDRLGRVKAGVEAQGDSPR